MAKLGEIVRKIFEGGVVPVPDVSLQEGAVTTRSVAARVATAVGGTDNFEQGRNRGLRNQGLDVLAQSLDLTRSGATEYAKDVEGLLNSGRWRA